MSGRSKREVAPPMPPIPAAGVPWRGAAVKPSSISTEPGEATTPPPGWWTAPPPQNSLFPFLYGAWTGAVPPPNGHGNLDTSTDLVEGPHGGFLNFLHNNLASFSAQCAAPTSSQHKASGSKGKNVINIDDGDDVIRTEKRLPWTPEEDVRLVSAWLIHSNDPISGNGKKNDHYWGEVNETYHKTTSPNRKRQVKHLRDRWQKIKRWVGLFCGSWNKATSTYSSGQSDDQLKEKELQFYLDDYKEGPFTVEHYWKIMRDEPKWLAILDDIDKSNKRKLDDDGGVGGNTKNHEGISEKERPVGTKEAKKQRNGKGKIKAEDNRFSEDMNKYMDIQAAASKRHTDFLETQQRVTDGKVEAARLRREASLLESYKALMCMDTSNMAEDMKTEHMLGLKMLREKMAGNN